MAYYLEFCTCVTKLCFSHSWGKRMRNMTFKLLITSRWWGALGEGVAEEQTQDEASRSVRRWWLPGIQCIMMMLHNICHIYCFYYATPPPKPELSPYSVLEEALVNCSCPWLPCPWCYGTVNEEGVGKPQ